MVKFLVRFENRESRNSEYQDLENITTYAVELNR